MGGGCSGLLPLQRPKEQELLQKKRASVTGVNALRKSIDGSAVHTKPPAPRPLSRVVGFVKTRSTPTGIDVGSKSSSAILRSNSFWLHEDDDRVDELINRWKAAEIIFLKGKFSEYLQAHLRSHPVLLPKGKNQAVSESIRLPVESLILFLTSKRAFVPATSTLLGVTHGNNENCARGHTLLSPVSATGGLPPLILRLPNIESSRATVGENLLSRYLCESRGGAMQPPLTVSNRFSMSISQVVAAATQSSLVDPTRCVPLWGLTARGIYQAFCVETLAISISTNEIQKNSPTQRTRTFHFHIRKPDVDDLSYRREKDKEEEAHSGPLGSLSLDFRDLSKTLAVVGGKGNREEMLIFLFLLFAETVSIPDAVKDIEETVEMIRNMHSKEYLTVENHPSNGTLTLMPIVPEYNDTLGSSSSPREIQLTVGSPRIHSSKGTEREECGEVLALTQQGLDCLVRFLILSQASVSTDGAGIQWANTLLDLETHEYVQTEGKDAKDGSAHAQGTQEQKPLYTFIQQAVGSRSSFSRVPLVTCSNGFVLPSMPVTLPIFLSILNIPSEIEFEENNDGAYPLGINIPGTNGDIPTSIFSTLKIKSSLSIFIEDVTEVHSAAMREEMREKNYQQKLETTMNMNSMTPMTSALVTSRSIEAKEEINPQKSLILPMDSADENSVSSANNSPRTKLKNSMSLKSVAPESSGYPTGSPQSTRKHRKSIQNGRVISPTFVVPVIAPLTPLDSQGPPLIPDNDPESVSVDSAATGTTVDSSNYPDTGKNTLMHRNVNAQPMSPTFSSSILAALSFSSHGIQRSPSSDSTGGNTNRNRHSTGSVSVHPSNAHPNDFVTTITTSACGLINLGNTCFMSSALQCLVHSPLLKEYFMSSRFRAHLNVKNPLGTKGVLTEEFASLIESMWASVNRARTAAINGQNNHIVKRQPRPISTANGTIIAPLSPLPYTHIASPCLAPHDFKRVLQTCKSQFQGQEQQDVQEFLAELMDALHEDLNRYTKYSLPVNGTNEEQNNKTVAGSASLAWRKLTGQSGKRVVTLHVAANSSPQDKEKEKDTLSATVTTATASVGSDSSVPAAIAPSAPLTLQAQGAVAWQQHLERNRSCIVDLFQGQLCSVVTCNECGNVSRTFDPFTSLSLPLPTQNDITVIVTMLRRMPRLSSAALTLALNNEPAGYSAVTEKILAAQMSAAKPIRLVIVLPRLSDVSDLRKAICHMLSHKTSSSKLLPCEDPYILLPEHLTLLDCYQDGGLVRNVLEDRESVLQLIDTISRSVVATPTGPTPRSESGLDIDVGNTFDGKPGGGRHRSESITIGSPAAASAAGLQGRAPEPPVNVMTLSCLAVESPKNIPFVLSLSSSRLVSRNASVTLSSTPSIDGDEKPKEEETLPSSSYLNTYTDELEYQEGGVESSEGDIVTDLDFEIPHGASAAHLALDRGERGENDIRLLKRKVNSSFISWPKTIEGLVIGRRVDALDHRNQWFSGTIVDKWRVTAEELQELMNESATRNGIDAKGRTKSKSDVTAGGKTVQIRENTVVNSNKERNKGPKGLGWNLRIHFDNFSGKWDEWFSAADYDHGRIARVYTYSPRKLKVLDVVVIQRLITLRNSQSSAEAAPAKVLNVKVFGYPVILQCESFRSCEHVHRVIAEQSIRYAQESQMKQMVESAINRSFIDNTDKIDRKRNQDSHSDFKSSDPPLPFTIRILSSAAPLASEGLEGLEMDLGLSDGGERVRLTSRRGSATEVQTQYRKSRSGSGLGTPGDDEKTNGVHYASAIDRANGFQLWEGSFFPRDPLRPVCNLAHPRLIVAVDWHCNATVNIPAVNGYKKGFLHLKDHDTYTRYLSTSAPPVPSPPPLPMSTPPSSRDYSKGASSGGSGGSGGKENHVTHAPAPPPSSSNSMNPSLEDCLKSFTATEELDENSWYCDHCKKLSSGSVSSSLSRLPDLLILHIKRFGMTARFREKIRAKVKFPLSSLNMKPFVTPLANSDKLKDFKNGEEDDSHMYDLYAVANHLGGMSGGHYTAMVKCEAEVTTQRGSGGVGGGGGGGNSNGNSHNGVSILNMSSHSNVSNSNSIHNSGLNSHNNSHNDSHNNSIHNSTREDPEGFSPASYDPNGAPLDTAWMCFDDDVVSMVPVHALEATIVSEAAYVLFYRRRQLTSSNIVNLLP